MSVVGVSLIATLAPVVPLVMRRIGRIGARNVTPTLARRVRLTALIGGGYSRMITDVEIFNALPIKTQQQVALDWIQRGKSEMMRGLGIATHYKFLLWLSAEYEIALDDLL